MKMILKNIEKEDGLCKTVSFFHSNNQSHKKFEILDALSAWPLQQDNGFVKSSNEAILQRYRTG